QFGSDFTEDGFGTVTGGTSLPAITLGYFGSFTTFSTSHWALHQGTYGADTDWFAVDLNGDGRTDFVRKISSTNCTAQVQLANATGTGFTQQTWTITPVSGTACIPPSGFTPAVWDTGDFNIDGKADLVVYCCESTTTPTVNKNFGAYVYLSTGT